jgi:hypothetical protein
LKKESFTYRYAGFGAHEIILYYDMVRMLFMNCWETKDGKEISIPEETARLNKVKSELLNSPDPNYGGIAPSCLIENERIRLPWLSPEEDSILEDDCPCCQAMASGQFEPSFWHLGGCHMDNDFAFSFCRTQAEWEEENGCLAEIAQSLEKDD